MKIKAIENSCSGSTSQQISIPLSPEKDLPTKNASKIDYINAKICKLEKDLQEERIEELKKELNNLA